MRSSPAGTSRRLLNAVLLTAIIYALLGFMVAWQAYAQTKSVKETGTVQTVPSGNDEQSVQAYYDYLNESNLLAKHETFVIDWPAIGWTYGMLGALLIVSYFFIFAWYARLRSHDLYPVESYNGYITERGGPVDPFNYASYIVLGSFMTYYAYTQILFGQLY